MSYWNRVLLGSMLGILVYRTPEGGWDAYLAWWHPVAWAVLVVLFFLQLLTGGFPLVIENGNPFRERPWHRNRTP